MKISVIIPTFNRQNALQRTFEFIANSYELPDEVIVVDQSQDPVIADSIQKLCNDQPFCTKYIWLSKPSSTKARNVGVDHAINEILVFMDDDVDVRLSTFRNIKHIFSDNSMAMVGGYDDKPAKSNSLLGYLFCKASYFKRYQGHVAPGVFGRFPISGRKELPESVNSEWAMGFFFAVRSDFVKRWNLKFDENLQYYAYAEDLDFSYSFYRHARENDLKCIISNLCSVTHNVSKEYRIPKREATFMYVIHREYIRCKYYNKWLSLFPFYLSSLGDIIYRLIHKEPVRDIIDALVFMQKNKNDIRKGNFHYDQFMNN